MCSSISKGMISLSPPTICNSAEQNHILDKVDTNKIATDLAKEMKKYLKVKDGNKKLMEINWELTIAAISAIFAGLSISFSMYSFFSFKRLNKRFWSSSLKSTAF
ncbi:hypothetical protein [Klebsiella quasipneumoniae]|uniref:hypothetical protein n=1 Tax=Klebsiella quasipneumoniae TaxID=1463165 RepID=UPI001D12FA99|nr:hypothetical protein [Klebsiella quasipneumoniae]